MGLYEFEKETRMNRFQSSNVQFKIVFGFSIIAAILQIVATALQRWVIGKTIANPDYKLTIGLWSFCVRIPA